MWSITKKIFLVALLVTLVYVGYIAIHALETYRSITVTGSPMKWCIFKCATTPNASDPNPIPTGDPNHLNVLVMGMRGADDIANGGLLTDTMMLVTVDKATKKAIMVSLPRDLYVTMPGYLSDGTEVKLSGKLNEVYVRGLEHGEGLNLASQIVSRITGLPVDRAVVFDFAAFGKIIDTIGGIDIYLDKPFSEPKQWVDGFSLPAGLNHLDGEKALYYARSRYSSSDFDRARRQQEVILAIKNKAASLGFLSDPKKVTGVLDSLKGNVKTNFQPWEFKDLLTLASSLKENNLTHVVLSTENLLYESKTAKGEYILLPRGDSFDKLREFMHTIFENPIPPHATPTPSISNNSQLQNSRAPTPLPSRTP